MRKILFFGFAITLSSCKKEDSLPPEQGGTHTYTGLVCVSGLPPVIGSCIDTAGELLFFHVPIKDNSSFNSPVQISAKIIKLKNGLTTSIVNDFGQDPFNTSSATYFTVGSQSGYAPTGYNASIDVTSDGRIFLCRSDLNMEGIYIYSSGTFAQQQQLDGITSITANEKMLYAAVGPLYDSTMVNLIQWPRIYQMDSTGSMSLYYEFPTTYSFNGPGMYYVGNNIYYPIDFSMDITMDSWGSMFVTFGSDNIIYKIDKNKNISIYNSSIWFPVSIDVDEFNRIYTVSPPQYDSNVNMIKPVEIYMLDTGGNQTLIYQGTNSGSVSSGLHHFSIAVSSWNKIFLTSPREGNIIKIQ